ncbi:unnamed protein product [Sympodiomycopsis kandeliae]
MNTAARALLVDQDATAKGKQVVLDGNNVLIADILRLGRSPNAVPSALSLPKNMQLSNREINAGAASRFHYGVNVTFGAGGTSIVEESIAAQDLGAQLSGCLAGDTAHVLPNEWVRATIALRINGFARGYSGVTEEICNSMHALLKSGLAPQVPVRGSVSASGDLGPLAYVAFGLAGSEHVLMSTLDGEIIKASEALPRFQLQPYCFQMKELLATINGTTMSNAAAMHVLDSVTRLSLLTQGTLTMFSEALLGGFDSFDPLLHDQNQPHPGQIEVAANQRGWFAGSTFGRTHGQSTAIKIQQLAGRKESQRKTDDGDAYLMQDRYGLRSSPQYLGPALQDIQAAHDTIQREVNGLSDNPVMVPGQTQRVVHGANFQGNVVANASEKLRDATAFLSRQLHELIAETINAPTSNGLPPCLTLRDPGLDGAMRAVDVASASYVTEAGFLANRVSHFSRATECGNQSLNSMALLSARYSAETAEVLNTHVATALVVASQAIDCRIAVSTFLRLVSAKLTGLIDSYANTEGKEDVVDDIIWEALSLWNRSFMVSEIRRAKVTAQMLTGSLAVKGLNLTQGTLANLNAAVDETLLSTWREISKNPPSYQDAQASGLIQLGKGSELMYKFVREEVGVPMFLGADKAILPLAQGNLGAGTFGVHITRLSDVLRKRGADHVCRKLLDLSEG